MSPSRRESGCTTCLACGKTVLLGKEDKNARAASQYNFEERSRINILTPEAPEGATELDRAWL